MNMPGNMIRVWLWDDAPITYQHLSIHGGDEEYVVFVPDNMVDKYHPFSMALELRGYDNVGSQHMTGWGWYDTPVKVSGGWIIIFAH